MECLENIMGKMSVRSDKVRTWWPFLFLHLKDWCSIFPSSRSWYLQYGCYPENEYTELLYIVSLNVLTYDLRTDSSLHVHIAGDWASQQMKGWKTESEGIERRCGCFEVAGCKKFFPLFYPFRSIFNPTRARAMKRHPVLFSGTWSMDGHSEDDSQPA